jgi:uncharacterized membrane protein YphA (DoxX/SURF4 family)
VREVDRYRVALTVLRLFIGAYFLNAGLGKLAWFADASLLTQQFANWSRAVPDASLSQWYLDRIAIPGVAVFARLVPLGEISIGVTLLAGLWTPVVAAVALLMVLNIHFASGVLFRYSSLVNGLVLPMLGGLLTLIVGGTRLPLSIRGLSRR